MNAQVAIIGCGVSGLTTGIVLREAGYDAHIVTTDWPQQTVSAKAAAIWFPFQIGPVVEANVWSKIAYSKFVELSAQANTGIVMRPLLELIADESDAWWKDALPASAIRRAEPHEIPAGFSMGYRMEVPIIETPIYLQWLLDRFQALGGTVTMQSIHNIHAFATDFPATINCTGLASRELLGDNALYPIRGQIVKVAPHSDVISMSADMQLWGSETDLAYLIPRRDCIVLGGNALADNADLAVDEAATLGILSRCAKLDARISELPILSVEVGLRPGRKEIRLAREGAIIHNYGHGGGGYTVSWGCAQAVLEILRGFLSAGEAMQG